MKDDSALRFLDSIFSPSKEDIWNKAHRCGPKNELLGFRKDDYGNWIHRDQYGNRNHEYGWEKDHIVAVANGGSDKLSNLRPLHWKENVRKSDSVSSLAELARWSTTRKRALL